MGQETQVIHTITQGSFVRIPYRTLTRFEESTPEIDIAAVQTIFIDLPDKPGSSIHCMKIEIVGTNPIRDLPPALQG